ncbi:aspartate aminotransferase family protein [Algimonas porphyrae]|uniref:Acetylornithine aminotransferase n=1 Tax=Algimonas porphyrae TaxID=1128113 RepID=A0ABQ5V3J8_9PROT|nr:aspartate aminotransferase family protein [Algimonas porphyrae]GLQ21557.1 acetylornithine aminotransferase [Algimonas porphyrae]
MAQGNHLFDCYNPPDITFERGEGAWLYTDEGERYLDFIAGIAVNALGHAPQDVAAAVTEQMGKVWHLSNMFKVPGQIDLSKRYCDALPWAEKVFFQNSGTESLELAMKTARRWQYGEGRPERVDIIGFGGAFHGRSFAAINAAGNPKYLEGFGPRLPGFINLPFGDHDALQSAVGETTAAILVEPVQGEGGVRALPPECLRGLRELCDENDLLLIYDEVQCGAGRTGQLFAHQWVDGGEPDIMAVAKGVGGGFPLGAVIASEDAAKHMVPGTHGTTYGGNPLAMAAGIAVWDRISQPEFLEHVRDTANKFRQALAGLKDEFPDQIEDVRGKGLLVGLKMRVPGAHLKAKSKALDHKLMVGTAGDNVLRMAPPLIIGETELRTAMDTLRTVLREISE